MEFCISKEKKIVQIFTDRWHCWGFKWKIAEFLLISHSENFSWYIKVLGPSSALCSPQHSDIEEVVVSIQRCSNNSVVFKIFFSIVLSDTNHIKIVSRAENEALSYNNIFRKRWKDCTEFGNLKKKVFFVDLLKHFSKTFVETSFTEFVHDPIYLGRQIGYFSLFIDNWIDRNLIIFQFLAISPIKHNRDYFLT